MKKLLLLGSLLVALQLNVVSQSIQVWNDDSTINLTGDTITFWHAEDPNITEAPLDWERKSFARVYNVTNDTISLKLTRKAIRNFPEAQDAICWGAQCYGPVTVNTLPIWEFSDVVKVYPNDYVKQDPIQNTIDYKLYFYTAGATGEALYNFKFYNQENPNDSASLFIKWSVSLLTDVNEISSAVQEMEVYPNPASSQFTVDLNSGINAANQEIIIRDLVGKTVLRKNIQNLQEEFIFSTSEMKSGIYFVSYALEGDVLATKKLIVR